MKKAYFKTCSFIQKHSVLSISIGLVQSDSDLASLSDLATQIHALAR